MHNRVIDQAMVPDETPGEFTMRVPERIMASRELKISAMMADTGCTRDAAITYLHIANWYLPDAIMSYNAAN